MAYSTEDLTRIDTAINSFISGDRKSSVTFRDGRSVSFAVVSLPDLQELRREIVSSLTISSRPKTSVFRTSKGL